MTIRTIATVAGFAFVAALTLNAGPGGLDLGTVASAQVPKKPMPNACVAQAERILRNPANYLGVKYGRPIDGKLKAMKLDFRRIAGESCQTARGNVKNAVSVGKTEISAMLMGLRKPVQVGSRPPHQKPAPKPQPSPTAPDKKAASAALKKQMAMLQAQCNALRIESSKLALQAKSAKDAKSTASIKDRLARAHALNAQCVRSTQVASAQSQVLDANAKIDSKALVQKIKEIEAQQNAIRDKRQMADTAFQNFDQKSNQLF
ncbi:MAG: hypothetical protein RIE56_14080, partial [Amphiplicatus sp.]